MIISKSRRYYEDKVRIDKKNNLKTAYKIQLYANKVTDKYIEDYKTGLAIKPSQAVLSNEFAIINNPVIYQNYMRILNSPYINDDEKNFLNKSILKMKADKNLKYVVEEEVKRLNKNLDVVEQVMNKYNFELSEYKKMVALQEQESMVNSNRFQVLRQAVENFDGDNSTFKIPEGYHYHEIKYTAENLLRESQMRSKREEVKFINRKRELEGEPPIWIEKYWIHTHRGKTTRHASNHMKHVPIDQPFLIVNDATLDVDEMMYPCDPNARPSNAYICYCECEYRGPNGEIFNDTIGDRKRLTFDTKVASLDTYENVYDAIDDDLKDLYIDINELEYFENIDEYGFNYRRNEKFADQVKINRDKSLTYKTLNIPFGYGNDYETHYIQSGYVYFKKSFIDRHNRNLLNKPLYYRNKLGKVNNYIKNSEKIKRQFDVEGENINIYAVDEKGIKYRIDQEYKDDLFAKQDNLQKSINYRKYKRGLKDYAYSLYRDINGFMFQNKEVVREGRTKKLGSSVMSDEDFNNVQGLFDELENAYSSSDEKLVNKIKRKINSFKKNILYANDLKAELGNNMIKDSMQIIGGIEESPGLQENVMLKRRGYWNPEWNKVGEVVDYGTGFVSTSYTEEWKTNFSGSKNSYEISILAPSGTKGVAMTDEFEAATYERELLLGRHQKWEVVEFNDTDYTVTVRVVNG